MQKSEKLITGNKGLTVFLSKYFNTEISLRTAIRYRVRYNIPVIRRSYKIIQFKSMEVIKAVEFGKR